MTDIPVDTPLGKTVEEIEAKAEQMALAPFSYVYECCETILVLGKALRDAHEKLSQHTLTVPYEVGVVMETRKELREAREEIKRLRSVVEDVAEMGVRGAPPWVAAVAYSARQALGS